MADDKKQGGSGAPQDPEDEFGDFLSDAAGPNPNKGSDFGALTGGGLDDEAGLGNLPPLSDFESGTSVPPAQEGGGGIFDSGSGLPPLDQIHTEVPKPTGGNIRPAPPGFEDHGAFDTPISDSGLDTPQTPSGLDTPMTPRGGGASFQDLTADSDFSPETPEIGPGPDSDLETPMFDSAFGAGGGFDRTPDTSAPTQAMETPIFGQHSGPSGFDADAFGGSSGSGGLMGGGTPIPDFSPDTGIPGGMAPPMPSGMEVTGTGAGVAPRGGMGMGALLAASLVMLLVGAGVGAWFLGGMSFTPTGKDVVQKEQSITSLTAEKNKLQARVNELMTLNPKDGEKVEISQEELDAMIARSQELTTQLATLEGQVTESQNKLNLVTGDIEQKTLEYAEAQKDYEQLVNQTSIERARSEGLAAEVQRLQDQVGTLEEATQRSVALKERLIGDVNRLEILIQDGIALVPAKYSHEDRLEAVRALKNEIASAKVVTPELLDQYTRLFEKEMEISSVHEYFFAKIPIQDRFGTVQQKWAEAVMNGNWSVYFRTLDGKQVGIYERIQGSKPARYSFRQFLDPAVAKQVEQEVISARVPGYEEKINSLAQREVLMDNKTGVQRVFDSL